MTTEDLLRRLIEGCELWLNHKDGRLHSDRDWKLKTVIDDVAQEWKGVVENPERNSDADRLADRVAKLERKVSWLWDIVEPQANAKEVK